MSKGKDAKKAVKKKAERTLKEKRQDKKDKAAKKQFLKFKFRIYYLKKPLIGAFLVLKRKSLIDGHEFHSR